MNPADSVSLIAFAFVLIFVIFAFYISCHVAFQRANLPASHNFLVVFGIFTVLIIFINLVTSGFVQDQPMPRLPMFFGIINIGAVALGLSPLGKLLAEKISFRGLVAFQAFRLPLEIILHAWALQSVIPQTMTWSGQNLDIISGILALLIFPLANRYKNLVWIFDIVGFLLLINVMRVAVMSSPLPFAWNISPALDLAFRLPYALIGPVCVGGALAGHIILTRKLLGG